MKYYHETEKPTLADVERELQELKGAMYSLTLKERNYPKHYTDVMSAHLQAEIEKCENKLYQMRTQDPPENERQTYPTSNSHGNPLQNRIRLRDLI